MRCAQATKGSLDRNAPLAKCYRKMRWRRKESTMRWSEEFFDHWSHASHSDCYVQKNCTGCRKTRKPYSRTIHWIRRKLNFLLRSSIMLVLPWVSRSPSSPGQFSHLYNIAEGGSQDSESIFTYALNVFFFTHLFLARLGWTMLLMGPRMRAA